MQKVFNFPSSETISLSFLSSSRCLHLPRLLWGLCVTACFAVANRANLNFPLANYSNLCVLSIVIVAFISTNTWRHASPRCTSNPIFFLELRLRFDRYYVWTLSSIMKKIEYLKTGRIEISKRNISRTPGSNGRVCADRYWSWRAIKYTFMLRMCWSASFKLVLITIRNICYIASNRKERSAYWNMGIKSLLSHCSVFGLVLCCCSVLPFHLSVEDWTASWARFNMYALFILSSFSLLINRNEDESWCIINM